MLYFKGNLMCYIIEGLVYQRGKVVGSLLLLLEHYEDLYHDGVVVSTSD